MSRNDEEKKQSERQWREWLAIVQARQQNRCVTYVDDDGCEVTATPSGHAFYNTADWY